MVSWWRVVRMRFVMMKEMTRDLTKMKRECRG